MPLIGITSAPEPKDSAKSVVHVFDEGPDQAFGIVTFTGAYWQVEVLSEAELPYDRTMALRRSAARVKPSGSQVLGEPTLHFLRLGRPFACASVKQVDYLARLGLHKPPQPALKHLCSRTIGAIKVVNSLLKDASFCRTIHGRELTAAELERLRAAKLAFLARDWQAAGTPELVKELWRLRMLSEHTIVMSEDAGSAAMRAAEGSGAAEPGVASGDHGSPPEARVDAVAA